MPGRPIGLLLLAMTLWVVHAFAAVSTGASTPGDSPPHPRRRDPIPTSPPQPPSILAASTTVAVRPSPNWVVVSMFAEGRYSVDFDAAIPGNGCSLSPATNVLIGPNGGIVVSQNPPSNQTP
jgi:hypothetical protein